MLQLALPFQPHGFEGLRPAQVCAYSRDSRFFELVQECRALVYADSAAGSPGGLMQEREHFVAEITDLFDLEVVVTHLLLKSPDVGDHLLTAPEHTGLWERGILLELHILGDVRRERIEIASIESLPSALHDLHVLLRHRLLLEAEVGECAVAVRVANVASHFAALDMEQLRPTR
jgi:hypothetical protein